MDSATYDAWIRFVFDRPETQDGWYWDTDIEDFPVDDSDRLALLQMTLERCGSDLTRFSLRQITHGLCYIFHNACSDVVFTFRASAIPLPDRLQALQSLNCLYRDLFAQRCDPMFCHSGAQEPTNPLNLFCYMLWDVCPLGYWEGNPDKTAVYDQLIALLATQLSSPNPACQESAVHGLSHLAFHDESGNARLALESFLQRCADPNLADYARQAATGRIQ